MICSFGLKSLKEASILFGCLIIIFQVRSCNTLVYTERSAYGCFVAIAVPLNIPHHNAFVSYNFETAYGLPKDPKVYLPGTSGYEVFGTKEDLNKNNTVVEVLHENSRKESDSARSVLQNKKSKNESEGKPLIKKRAIYQMLQDKLKMSGFKGEHCLLKLICEVNSSMIGRNNGVLGTILHILISPSSSANENLPKKYYKAESNGVIGDCFKYDKNCPYSLLDIFSVPIESLLKKHLNTYISKLNYIDY
ncbi:uncharacterized protein LOC129946635 [Eupeodes corollae]|uniref:uncharacterized protein LOC129946635 n=1 Tax=Eupeodes corollae TaxID=290404 RepID=UPI002492E96B|nr:uncharacterized protein LOC129946635 [Eupeodes corollae]